MAPKRHWFHCSTVWHGSTWEPVRRPPITRCESEPATPRLCVCPTVAPCFAATIHVGRTFVYRTETPRKAIAPRSVWDALVTRERWLIPPVRMVHVDTIEADKVDRINAATLLFLAERPNGTGLRVRLCQYAIALREVGGTAWEHDFVDDLLRVGKIADPEDFILSEGIRRGRRRRT